MHPIEQRLKDLGFALPAAPAPAANYVPFVVTGTLSRLARAGQRIVSVIQVSDGVREALHGWKIPCNGD